MKREEIELKVKNFLIEEIEVDEAAIKSDALLKEDLGIDSLDFVDIILIGNGHAPHLQTMPTARLKKGRPEIFGS